MVQESEVIMQNMEDTRSSLADKLETLEQHVLDTVQETTSAVTDVTEKVTEAVEGTVDTVKQTVESVVETFNPQLLMERHPWIAVGGSVALGFVLGRIISAGERAAASTNVRAGTNGPTRPPSGPSFINQLIAPHLATLKTMALGGVMSMARDFANRAFASNDKPSEPASF